MKLYVYADESFSHSPGDRTFVVAVVICVGTNLDQLDDAIEHLEQTSLRGLNKWKDSNVDKRLVYLAGLHRLAELAGGPFYWRLYPDRDERDVKTAETVAAAIQMQDPDDVTHRVITIDALSKASRDRVTTVFSRRKVHRRDVRGARDESSTFVRLADSLAGFLRHVAEGKPYAVKAWAGLKGLFCQV